MSRPPKTEPERGDARSRLLDAARDVIRRKGFAATTIDDVCATAAVTKGAFFHHFPSKQALGVAAAENWSETTSALFAAAPFHGPDDPLDRIRAYLDFRRQIIVGEPASWTCLVGTMVQEVYATSADIRDACGRSIFGHARTLEADIDAAISLYGVNGNWTAASLARHFQAVLQGAFVLAKAASGNPARARTIAAESIDHLSQYVECLFNTSARGGSSRE